MRTTRIGVYKTRPRLSHSYRPDIPRPVPPLRLGPPALVFPRPAVVAAAAAAMTILARRGAERSRALREVAPGQLSPSGSAVQCGRWNHPSRAPGLCRLRQENNRKSSPNGGGSGPVSRRRDDRLMTGNGRAPSSFDAEGAVALTERPRDCARAFFHASAILGRYQPRCTPLPTITGAPLPLFLPRLLNPLASTTPLPRSSRRVLGRATITNPSFLPSFLSFFLSCFLPTVCDLSPFSPRRLPGCNTNRRFFYFNANSFPEFRIKP